MAPSQQASYQLSKTHVPQSALLSGCTIRNLRDHPVICNIFQLLSPKDQSRVQWLQLRDELRRRDFGDHLSGRLLDSHGILEESRSGSHIDLGYEAICASLLSIEAISKSLSREDVPIKFQGLPRTLDARGCHNLGSHASCAQAPERPPRCHKLDGPDHKFLPPTRWMVDGLVVSRRHRPDHRNFI